MASSSNMLKSFHDEVLRRLGEPISPTNFTITADAWTQNSGEISAFVYVANIPVIGLTSADYATVDFNRTSQAIVSEANICASGETSADAIKIFAEKIPTSAIRGQFVIFKATNGADH